MHFTPDHEHFHEPAETGGLDARAKIVMFLGVAIAAVSTPRGQWHVLIAYAVILGVVATALLVPPLRVLKKLAVAAPFVLFVAILLPFRPVEYARGDQAVFLGPLTLSARGIEIFLDVAAKAALSITSLACLASVENMPGVSRGLQRMGVPAIIVTLLNVTYRYMFVLRDEALRLKRARDARAFGGRWIWHARVIGLMVGSLFLRSIERAERVYAAMASRCYEGGALRVQPRALKIGEWLVILSSGALLIAVRFLPA